jgi:hypothetical protein
MSGGVGPVEIGTSGTSQPAATARFVPSPPRVLMQFAL